MPTINLSPLGVSGGIPGGNGGQHGERQKINGWSLQSARGNTRFLRSVVVDQLPEYGLAFTFTVRDLPTPQQWSRLKKQIVRALTERYGCVCWHMVTEWTKAGRPHLHGCAFWFEFEMHYHRLGNAWLHYSAEFGTLNRGQLIKQIDGADGWFIYMAKHAARGLGHYQRQADAMPPEWRSQTGRVWSQGGRWPTKTEVNEVTLAEFYRFRRMIDRVARAEAKAGLNRALRYGDKNNAAALRKRLIFLRKLRKAFGGGSKASATRGINQWVSGEVSGKLLRWSIEHEVRPGTSDSIEASLEAHGLSSVEVPF